MRMAIKYFKKVDIPIGDLHDVLMYDTIELMKSTGLEKYTHKTAGNT